MDKLGIKVERMKRHFDLIWSIDGYENLDDEKIEGYAFPLTKDNENIKYSEELEKLVYKYLLYLQEEITRLVAVLVSKNFKYISYYTVKEKPEFSAIDKRYFK